MASLLPLSTLIFPHIWMVKMAPYMAFLFSTIFSSNLPCVLQPDENTAILTLVPYSQNFQQPSAVQEIHAK